MSDQPGSELDRLDLDLIRRIDAACRRFEADWREGRPAPLDDYLGDVPEGGRLALRVELEALERELRGARGDRTDPSISPPSTIAGAPTVAPADSPTAAIPGLAAPPVHEQATVAPRDDATVDYGSPGPAETDAPERPRVRYFGDYEILRELARGGMGVVLLARQMSLNRPVALKMILAGQLANDTDVKRFYTEAEAAANLDHPGIVPIYEVGQHEGQHYFSMGFVEGQSLAQRLAEGPLPPRDAAALMVKVAEAIEYAHRRGVIHRDLKPGNILLDCNGDPRVTDFGLAKKLQGDSGLTGSGQIMGTPSYMPPEQAGGKRGEVGPAADVYALGATLYATLTGRPPFQAATAMDTVIQVLSDQPVPPRRLNASIPLDLETICLKCLEKELGKRYASAAALGEELQRYLAGKPILARPLSQTERAWRWCRRNPALSAAISAAALGLVAAATVSIVYAVDRGNAARRLESLNLALKEEGERTLSALRETNRQLSIVALERAERHRSAGESGHGALQLVEAVHFALEAGNADLERSARATLGVWENDLHRLRSVAGGAALVEGVRLGWTAFGADGRTALVGWAGGAEVLDVATGRRTGPRLSFPGVPTAVAISRDGKVAAIAATDLPDPAKIASMVSGVRLFETASGKSLGVMIQHPAKANSDAWFRTIQAIAFSADGKTLLTGGLDRIVRCWDVATGKEVRAALEHPEAVATLIVSSDGRAVAAKGAQTIRVWDGKTGQPIGKDLNVQAGAVSTALSRDGMTLLTGGADGFVRFWSCNSGQETSRIDGGRGPVLAVAFSPDGKRVLTSTQSGAVRLWETATRTPIGAPMHHAGEVSVLAFQPDGKAGLTATMDGTVRVWELSTGLHPQQSWKPGGAVRALAIRPDGRALLASYGHGLARLWDPASGAPLGPQLEHSGNAESVAFSPDGKVAVTGGWGIKRTGGSFAPSGEVFRWDASNGGSLGRLLDSDEMVRSVAFLPDGRSLLVLSTANLTSGLSARLYDPIIAAPLGNSIKFGSERVDHAVLSPDGKRVLTASHPGKSARLWDVATGQPVGSPINHPDWVMSIAYRPDGKAFATGCKDQIARIWDADTGQPVGKPMINGYQVVAMAFSPDGQTLVTGCQDFLFTVGEARLWNASTGQPLAPPMPHAHAVTAVAFRPDGKAVATGDAALSLSGPGDGNISIWNLPAPDKSDVADLRRRIQVWTGLKLQDADRFEALEPEGWQKLRQE